MEGMEKFSSIDRVVGDVSEGVKEKITEIAEQKFEKQDRPEFEGKEREKTPEEMKMVQLANFATNEILEKYHLEYVHTPPENIHIMRKGLWKNFEEGTRGHFYPLQQMIALEESPVKCDTMLSMIHEMIHFKSYTALQVSEKTKKTDLYRIGLQVTDRNTEYEYFRSLNEAITEDIAKEICLDLFANQHMFDEEWEETQNTIRHYLKLTPSNKPRLNTPDVFYMKKGESSIEEKNQYEIKAFSYSVERQALHLLINTLYERNRDQFEEKSEVRGLFIEAMLTGNLLSLGKLIDKTFDKGEQGYSTFRHIGQMEGIELLKMVDELVKNKKYRE